MNDWIDWNDRRPLIGMKCQVEYEYESYYKGDLQLWSETRNLTYTAMGWEPSQIPEDATIIRWRTRI